MGIASAFGSFSAPCAQARRLHHLKQVELQVICLGHVPQNGVIRRLLARGNLPQLHPGVRCRGGQHFAEFFLRGKVAAAAGGQVAPARQKAHGAGVDFFIAAQTAKHVIRQGLKEAERSQMYAEMQGNTHEIVSATVTNLDMARGIVTLELSKGGVATLPRNEQVPGEEYYEGQHLQVYVVDVRETERGPRMMISRTHPGLVKRMFEMEVPEIYDGTVEIKAISREAGARTKMAVWSKDENVDPVGACIGPRGARVAKIVDELGGEKIDIVRWSEDPAAFISEALSPAKVVDVELLEGENRAARVTVPDHQLSLAIGNRGQNARLTARLTGYSIDIRPESGYYGEEPPVKKTQE